MIIRKKKKLTEIKNECLMFYAITVAVLQQYKWCCLRNQQLQGTKYVYCLYVAILKLLYYTQRTWTASYNMCHYNNKMLEPHTT
jgi:hypothetical protein